jgi:NAD(P)-dependent dehydrogenase (short-subunit alcohol dehydrogenase family)
MDTTQLSDKVALVTGGASGIGAAVASRLSSHGVRVVLADVADEAGAAVASDIGGTYVHCDVREMEENEAAVAVAVERFGGLDIAFLNAGVTSGCGIGDDFDPVAYRRAMGINLDGVVYGAHAALPALKARGGGSLIATASMAGIVPVALDPLYVANKHAVVGLMRSLGEALAPDGITANALCPSFAETPLITDAKPFLEEIGFPILDVADVVETFMAVLERGRPGEAWFVIPGRESEPFQFRRAPGPRA